MAGFVVLSNGLVTEFHTGARVEYSSRDLMLVEEVQADGHELDWIMQWFNDSIPCHKGRAMNWYGDIAKMIAKSLYHLNK